jgi:hypothetical protein
VLIISAFNFFILLNHSKLQKSDLERFSTLSMMETICFLSQALIRYYCNQFHLQKTHHSEGISLSQIAPKTISCHPHEKVNLIWQVVLRST